MHDHEAVNTTQTYQDAQRTAFTEDNPLVSATQHNSNNNHAGEGGGVSASAEENEAQKLSESLQYIDDESEI